MFKLRRTTLLAGLISIAPTAAGGLFLAGPAGADGPQGGPQGGQVSTDYGRMLLLLDSSGSMKDPAGGGQTKIEAARHALEDVIAALPADADVGLRVFGATVFSRKQAGACQDTQLVVPPGTGNRDGLRAAVAKYKPYGETPIPAALKAAAADLGSEGKRSIVLVSDGESTCAPDPCTVATGIAAQGLDVQIDVVGLSVSGRARRQLQCIAANGHGTYYDADNARDLSQSLGRISDRAVQPFAVGGQDVSGTASPTGEPTIRAGVWRDGMPAEGHTRHYRITRTIPGSTLWVGVVAQPNKTQQKLDLRLVGDDGQDCGEGYDYNGITGGDSATLLGVQANSDAEQRCSDSAGLDLEISKDEWSSGAASVPMQITVVEEPPLADDSGLPAGVPWTTNFPWQTTPRPTGTPRKVVFGSSLADAPLLADGGYHTEGIVPGESQLYRIHLDWGQAVQVRLVLPVTSSSYDAYGVQAPVVRAKLLSPLGGRASNYSWGKDEHGTLLDSYDFPPTSVSQGTRYAYVGTAPVRYRNRDETNQESTALPGDYYLMVSQETSTGDESVVTPYDIEVTTLGTAGQGAPHYVGDTGLKGGQSQPGGTASAADAADGPSSRGSADGTGGSGHDHDHLRVALGSAAGGLGVVGLAAAAFLVNRRRRA
ncbi:vWA domain-containing protein [Nocardioides montaniterrae]